MKVLIVEDDESIVDAFRYECARPPAIITIVAGSRDEAFSLLQTEQFDLAICDLVIPTKAGALDGDVEYGKAVYSQVRNIHPGTPVIIFSAFATMEFLSEILAASPRADLFGSGNPQQLTAWLPKTRLVDAIAQLRSFQRELTSLANIEIRPDNLFAPFEKRVVRVFSRRLNGQLVEASPIGGGLSGSKTARIRVTDAGGTVRTNAVAKLGPRETILDENSRYLTQVLPRLEAGAFATKIDDVRDGCGPVCGIFYRLAEGFDECLFDVLATNEQNAVEIVERIQLLQQPWWTAAPRSLRRIGDIRALVASQAARDLCGDLIPLDSLLAFEDRQVVIASCPQHGDLHGENVLVHKSLRPQFIDYGEVRELPASFDAVVLELSLLFHPSGRKISGQWPSADRSQQWFDLENYLVGCPIPNFIRACRKWAHSQAAANRELAVNVYAYAVRNRPYPDTENDLSNALIVAAMNQFD